MRVYSTASHVVNIQQLLRGQSHLSFVQSRRGWLHTKKPSKTCLRKLGSLPAHVKDCHPSMVKLPAFHGQHFEEKKKEGAWWDLYFDWLSRARCKTLGGWGCFVTLELGRRLTAQPEG